MVARLRGKGREPASRSFFRWRSALDRCDYRIGRRLVYRLPMRTLVEQTTQNVERWLKNISQQQIGVHVRMGGEEKTEWDLYPEREAILIGTQDMLRARARATEAPPHCRTQAGMPRSRASFNVAEAFESFFDDSGFFVGILGPLFRI